MIVVLCMVGSYTITSSMYGIVVMLCSAFVGYFMTKYKYPVPPMLLAFVLAPMLEKNMRQAFIASTGKVSTFFTHPISLAFMIVFFLFLLFPLVKMVVNKIKARPR